MNLNLKFPRIAEKKVEKVIETTKGYDPFDFFVNMGADFLGITVQNLTLHEFFRKYKHHIRNCIDLIAEDVMDMEWGFFKYPELTEKIKQTPYTDLFLKPNEEMDWQDLIFSTIANEEIGGNGYWWYPEQYRLVGLKKMFFLPAQYTSYDYDNSGHWVGYKFLKHGIEMKFKKEEIIHFKYLNPGDPTGYGLGTVQGIASIVNRFDSIEDFEESILNNMGVMSAVVSGGNEKNNRRIVTELKSISAGSKNVGKIVGAPQGYEIKNGPGFSPKQIGLLEIKQVVAEEIYMCFKVPRLLVGITESVNRSNMYEATKAFKTYKTFKVAKRLQRKINSSLLWNESFDFKFIYTLPKDPELEIEKNIKYIDAGVVSRKEVRVEEGKSPYPGSDKVLMRIGFVEGESTDITPKPGKSESKNIEISNTKVYDPLKFGEQSNKAFRQWQEALEPGFSKQLGVVWNWLGKKVGQNLRGYKSYNPELLSAEVIPALDIITEEFADKNNGFIKEAIERMAIQRVAELKIQIPDDMLERYLIDYYEHLKDTWKGIAGTDVNQLSKIITDGINEDRTLASIAKEIESKYKPTSSDFMNQWRAGTIARTETSMAANKTSHDVMEYGGIATTVWIVSGSGRERPWHLEAHGQTVGINEPYIVMGERLMYPGDRNGSPANIINCQCNEVPFASYAT